MEGETVKVVRDNEHLGQVVSGIDEESKNVDARLSKGRKLIFSLLGPVFAQKCLLNPLLKLHVFRLLCCPTVRCGLSAMTLRDSHMKQINLFHKKLRAFLGLSDQSPSSGLFFIFGELPLEARIHRDVFSIFYSVLSNPGSKIHEVVKYLLEEAANNSRTWSKYVQQLSARYDLPDPLVLMKDLLARKKTD